LSPSLAELLERVGRGDEQAAAELVRRYEPLIRRELRFRLRDRRLARLVGSLDVCQSVLASFFAGCAAGRFDLRQPERLQALLLSMARIKLAFQARKHLAGCRDYRRQAADDTGVRLAAAGASPSRIVAARDLLAAVRGRLSPDERRLADLRGQGHDWAEIARQVGGRPDSRRKQLGRALDRVARQLHLEGEAHG
jgi:RNA polymerase sigma-70 factor (ECF subfamily)